MSETTANPAPTPGMIRIQLRIERWSNAAPGGGHLIDPAKLARVNRALDEVIAVIKRRSAPTLRKADRLLPLSLKYEPWLIHRAVTSDEALMPVLGWAYWGMRSPTAKAVDSAMDALRDAWADLQQRWPALVAKSKPEIHGAFPAPETIWRHFIAWGETDGVPVDTHELLGRFSVFEPPDPPTPTMPSPDPLNGIRFTEKLKHLYAEKWAGKITHEEFMQRAVELEKESLPRG